MGQSVNIISSDQIEIEDTKEVVTKKIYSKDLLAREILGHQNVIADLQKEMLDRQNKIIQLQALLDQYFKL